MLFNLIIAKIKLKKHVNLITYLYKLRKSRRNQRQSLSELEKLREEKLKALLHHAYYKVDYYRRLFDQSGIRPEDIKNIQDLTKIPITTRKEIQALPQENIIAKDIVLSHCCNLRTSGSTGMPLNIFVSPKEIISRWLSYRRMYFDNGGKLTDKELRIVNYQKFKEKQWFQRLGVLRVRNISIFEDIEEQLKAILEFKPEIIRTQVSTLKDLAIKAQKQRIKDINPRIIFSTSELLTKQDRDLVTFVFQAEVFDYYACNECGIIAWECKEHFGYHLNSDSIIVEFIKEDGTMAKAGEEGEIVITSLNSYTMPFIRYRLGDMGIPSDEKCSCGNKFPLMKIITGRINDYIALPSGKRVSPYKLMMAMDKIIDVKKYQIIQEIGKKIKINIVQTEAVSDETISKIAKGYREILNEYIDIEVEVVKDILVEKTGKFKVISSNISYR